MNDFGDDDLRRDDGDGRPRFVEEARSRVQTPGLLLQVLGVIIIVLQTMNGALSLISPETQVDWQLDMAERMQKDQPPAQRQKLPPRDEAIRSQQVQGPIFAFLWVAAGVVMFIGGAKMRALRGYGWSIAGCIMGIFPGMCCCCLGLVPGIWGLVVLLNSDVKLAFQKVAAEAAGGA